MRDRKVITDVPIPPGRIITDAPSEADPRRPQKPIVEPIPKKPLVEPKPTAKPLKG
jgi:hypothetical protein